MKGSKNPKIVSTWNVNNPVERISCYMRTPCIHLFLFLLGKREFLVRWKYCKPSDDTWEPEDNLGGSEDIIDKFMDRYDQTHCEQVSEKSLREGPKQIERLTF